MRKSSRYLLAMVFGFCFSGFVANSQPAMKQPIADSVIIMELFTSQGCSSCPPADALMKQYAVGGDETIIPLSFHIDYWNYIGWKDPFSQHRFSERQRDYARSLNASVYTPQLIINGQFSCVGSEENTVRKAVQKELQSPSKVSIQLQANIVSQNQIRVNYDTADTNKDIVNIALVKKKEVTSIKRGENEGQKLTGYNIVIDFISKPVSKNADIVFSFTDKNPADYFVVAYIQNKEAGKILGGSKTEIKP